MLTALLVPVPEAAPALDGWRERTARTKPSSGMPPHVTLLFPFADSDEVDYGMEDDLRHLFARFEPFDFTLGETGRFPTTLYLAPDPAEPFVELSRAIVAQYPQWQPYGGEIDEIVPHLTVAQGEAALLDAAEAEIASALPIAGRAAEVVLFEERERFGLLWEPRARFPLGASG